MDADVTSVPPPEPPDSRAAWYASGVHDQYEIVPGVVATVVNDGDAFGYRVRTPTLSAAAESDLETLREHFSGTAPDRPRTREGATERFREGFDPKYGRIIDRLTDCATSERRRLEYHALAELRCLGELTPHALDDRVEVGDHSGEELSVHLTDYAPARTGIEEPRFLGRFSAERIERYTVEFAGYEIPVVRYREQLLGADPFEHKYAVLEPDLLPEDERLIAECKARIWEAGIDGIDDRTAFEDRAAVVRERGRQVLSKRRNARDVRT